MWKVSDHPLLNVWTINLKPGDLFRIEGKPFHLSHDTPINGNVVMMFTGLYISDYRGTDSLHCIPIYFYGPNARFLTSELKGQVLWLEIESYRYSEGYWN